jgi:hypothetical protein
LPNEVADLGDRLGVNRGVEHGESEAELSVRNGRAEQQAKTNESDDDTFFHGSLFLKVGRVTGFALPEDAE